MAEKSHLEVQAAAWRELAERARRLATGLLEPGPRPPFQLLCGT